MFKTISIGIIQVFILVALLVLAGCGGNGQAETSSDSNTNEQTLDTEESSNEEDVTENSEDTRVIEHALGETEVSGTPSKVVTLFQGATDASLLLEIQPAGAVEAWVEKPWYNYIRDEMDGVTNLGLETQPNIEEIIALQPDLIIASKTRHEEIYDQLSNIAPTVVTEDHFHWKEILSLTADALNKEEEEQAFLTEWEEKVMNFKEKLGSELENTEVAIVGFRSDHARIFYNTFPALIIDELGLKRPANQVGDDWGVKLTSKENIPEMDADIIFDMTSVSRDDGRVDTREDWVNHPLWANLRAVQNDRVYSVDPVIWTNGSGPIAATKMLEDLYEYFELE
ncbi:ABC transporter substrate-binding protein [Aquibacillus rhizosphaerae]|uniref:Iron-siderophore ABC transporter substrate-binding protein n=1 Tax=Aquibacillus rhizosphaerae TaxID=3051431 RepID=A0ABT7L8F6_9BACI|nr:iron-siderophore ABC transporter substrate-binding protein [Aquibacillus sp. LR5S19]MDL4842143.1 iron-siderophore ABC transporter substrate-binding protein [Aquibacillus sp. LR5S19]